MSAEETRFRKSVECMVSEQGYGLNSCPGHCSYRGDEHAHLRLPRDGQSFIVWADGRFSGFDLVQPAGAYVPVPRR